MTKQMVINGQRHIVTRDPSPSVRYHWSQQDSTEGDVTALAVTIDGPSVEHIRRALTRDQGSTIRFAGKVWKRTMSGSRCISGTAEECIGNINLEEIVSNDPSIQEGTNVDMVSLSGNKVTMFGQEFIQRYSAMLETAFK